MRNLRIIGRSLLRFASNDLPLSATAWDTSSNSLLCAFGPSDSKPVIELKRLQQRSDSTQNDLATVASWDAPCPLPSLSCDIILDLHHFSDSSTSCLVLAGGDIIVVRENPISGEDLIEIVGSVDAGISAAAWSPDEDLLAITTKANTLLFMTREFDNITSTTFTSDDVKVSNHVSVGWGKAETQFKGKRARAMQDPTVPEHVDEGVLSRHDDHAVAISWRGDGAYIAINAVEGGKRRMIRVYSREGQLDSVSEPVDGLEGALSWRPSGNLIASIKRSNHRIEVILFERNGLRHGQFDLRLAPSEVDGLSTPLKLGWNSDSSVLAVCFPNKTQLWTMGNYHYYLKQELSFLDKSLPIVSNTWNSERPLQLCLATPGAIQVLELISKTESGSTCPPNDFGLMGVIDGSLLRITPLRVANLPPPMSLCQIDAGRNVLDVAFSVSSTRLAVLTESDVSLYALEINKKPVAAPTLLWRSSGFHNYCPRHVAMTNDERVFVLTDQWEEDCELWECEKDQVVQLGQLKDIGRISFLSTRIDHKVLYLQTREGSVKAVILDFSSTAATPLEHVLINKFQSFAPDMMVINWNGQAVCFGLTSSGTLYANDRILVRNCTSFLITPAHLIFTTTQNYLKFTHLTNVEALEIPPDEPQKDERCRSVERGARLVTVIPTTYSVVLQMPRGNLETIYPRALVLANIRRSIETKNYADAFLTCRTQRVDMNILHDHAPEQFMANIESILAQVKRADHIDLFLSQLRDEDVSKTIYKETTKGNLINSHPNSQYGYATDFQPNKLHPEIGPKVNRICDAFLEVLQYHKEDHLQNIITAYVCKTPPDLEAGLLEIGKLQEAKDELADRAAEHICFLADVNQLYDTSLGIYNLELALLIAQQSQKDPREYLPYLQSLQKLPVTRRRFTIDDQLGRRSKALRHLHNLEAFDELEAYVLKHSLYSEAIELLKYQPLQLNKIMKFYADFLYSRNRFKEAGLAYEYLSDYSTACAAYRAASLWREALSSAIFSGMPQSELVSLATDLAETLVESKDFFSAATIHIDYLSDIASAARILCKGCLFSEAIRIVTLREMKQLVEEVVDPGLVERSGDMTEFLAECKAQLQAQVPRLRELRLKKSEDPLAFFDGAEGLDIPDNVSLAPTDASTSAGTFMTRYTNRTGTINTTTTRKTSKNRRREERKRARGKKGSVYEEEYLVNSIGRLIDRLNSANEEVHRLVEGLIRRGMRERATAVIKAARDLMRVCDESIAEVFETGKDANEASQPGINSDRHIYGGDAVLQESIEEGSKKREPPVLKAFENLSVLV